MGETVISIKDLSKSFGNHEVLRKIDIDIEGYFKFLKNIFRQKRKNVRNNLNGLYDLDKVLEVLSKYNLDLSVRAEGLSEEILVDIYKNVTR